MPATDNSSLTFEIRKSITIAASPEIVWETTLEQITSGMTDNTDKPLGLKLEPWPGGRYFRDLGDDTGHFWGHVQVIKPPRLLEICGPLFLSMPVTNHLQYRITAAGEGSELSIVHRAVGIMDPEHREGVGSGWQSIIDGIKAAAEKR